jgi:hypothetical protein
VHELSSPTLPRVLILKEDEDTTFGIEQAFERWVGENYVVSPVDSRQSRERVEFRGAQLLVRHVVFSYGERNPHPGTKQELADQVKRRMLASWPAGSHVIWRRRPHFDASEHGALVFSVRLGCVEFSNSAPPLATVEGAIHPGLGD